MQMLRKEHIRKAQVFEAIHPRDTHPNGTVVLWSRCVGTIYTSRRGSSWKLNPVGSFVVLVGKNIAQELL